MTEAVRDMDARATEVRAMTAEVEKTAERHNRALQERLARVAAIG